MRELSSAALTSRGRAPRGGPTQIFPFPDFSRLCAKENFPFPRHDANRTLATERPCSAPHDLDPGVCRNSLESSRLAGNPGQENTALLAYTSPYIVISIDDAGNMVGTSTYSGRTAARFKTPARASQLYKNQPRLG